MTLGKRISQYNCKLQWFASSGGRPRLRTPPQATSLTAQKWPGPCGCRVMTVCPAHGVARPPPGPPRQRVRWDGPFPTQAERRNHLPNHGFSNAGGGPPTHTLAIFMCTPHHDVRLLRVCWRKRHQFVSLLLLDLELAQNNSTK